MFARSTTINGEPGSVEEAITYVRDEVMPAMQAIDGCTGLSMLANSRTGRAIVTTSWRDEAAMQASRDAVRPTAERTAEVLRGTADVQEWEIAAMHRVHETHHSTCSRVTWLRSDPEAVDRAVDAVRLSLMPKLEDLPGFCSVSIMVRRADGLTVAAVSYDSWQDLEDASEGAREFRDEFAPAMGIQPVDTADFDIAIAQLRVPETI